MADRVTEEKLIMTKIEKLHEWLDQHGYDAFLVPRADQFQGEFVAPCDERLLWLTGFTGSAGMAVILKEQSALFVDSRYTIQAPEEVDTHIFEICNIPQTHPIKWLKKNLVDSGVIAFDPRLHTWAQIRAYQKILQESGITLKEVKQNPIDIFWPDRPKRQSNPIWQHDLKYTGKRAEDKISDIKTVLQENKTQAVLITDPESVSWLLNIRGSDAPCTPLVHAYVWLDHTGDNFLFIDQKKLSQSTQNYFDEFIQICDFANLENKLNALLARDLTLQIDPQNCPYQIYQHVHQLSVKIIEKTDPCLIPKACKNDIEISAARDAHKIDGVALVKLMHWFDTNYPAGNLDELKVVEKLYQCRTENDHFFQDSFETIAGFASNGAIVHYEADEKSNLSIEGDNLLLLDSGGQYPSGTTDITRMLPVGQPSQEMVDRTTLVLKGMIAVTQARFPVGTKGAALDTYARHALWQAGLDYGHGTGHGVGSFLSVHEGPHGIYSRSMVELKPGMILSNEPGYYKENAYGIRIENLILVVEDKQEHDEISMLAFETLTLAPIDRRLVNDALLTENEKQWLEDYHRDVYQKLSGDLSDEICAWLKTIL